MLPLLLVSAMILSNFGCSKPVSEFKDNVTKCINPYSYFPEFSFGMTGDSAINCEDSIVRICISQFGIYPDEPIRAILVDFERTGELMKITGCIDTGLYRSCIRKEMFTNSKDVFDSIYSAALKPYIENAESIPTLRYFNDPTMILVEWRFPGEAGSIVRPFVGFQHLFVIEANDLMNNTLLNNFLIKMHDYLKKLFNIDLFNAMRFGTMYAGGQDYS